MAPDHPVNVILSILQISSSSSSPHCSRLCKLWRSFFKVSVFVIMMYLRGYLVISGALYLNCQFPSRTPSPWCIRGEYFYLYLLIFLVQKYSICSVSCRNVGNVGCWQLVSNASQALSSADPLPVPVDPLPID